MDQATKGVLAAFAGIAAFKSFQTLSEITSSKHSYVSEIYQRRNDRPKDSCIVSRLPYFLNKDNLYIFWRTWNPAGPPKAVIVISHGLNEHSGRYQHVAKALTNIGFKVYALDHQGHGQSEGDRLFTAKFTDIVGDVVYLCDKAKSEHPDLKMFLMGHSMGGLVAILTTLRVQDKLAGAIYSAPALYLDPKKFPQWLLTLLGLVSKYFPKARPAGLDIATLCKDKDVVDMYVNDPLVSKQFATARLSAEITASFQTAHTNAKNIKVPFLLVQGTADKLVPLEGARRFAKAANEDCCTFKTYEGGFHEMFNAPDYLNGALKDVLGWLSSKL